jgi:hypothetical protein
LPCSTSGSTAALSFSTVFGSDETLLGVAKLALEVSDPSLERAEIALGRKAQRASDPLHLRLEGSFKTAAETKGLEGQPLKLRIRH